MPLDLLIKLSAYRKYHSKEIVLLNVENEYSDVDKHEVNALVLLD